jgi:ubiquinone/menaquinone biosynthesis C-methylase UbiE
MQAAGDTGATPALIFDTMIAYQRTASLKTAVELGVFGAVGEGANDAASIAKKCSSSERGIRILCDFLVINGLLAKEGGKYTHSPTSALFLDPKSPACMGSVTQFLGNPILLHEFQELTKIVRDGRTTLPGQGSVEPENPMWVQFAEAMAPLMATVAGPFAEICLQGKTGPMKVLDIAAGHGLFGINAAKRNPEARITALDWRMVLEVAQRNAKKEGVDGRYELLPGSAFDVEFGGPYELIMLTNFLHHFDVPTCTSLLRKCRAALKPGGTVGILEFVPNDDRVTPALPAAFSMMMLSSTAAGDAYTFGELEKMLKDAGFKDASHVRIGPSPNSAVLGTAG